MNEAGARAFREAYNAAVKRYSRMTVVQLKAENAAAQEAAGIEHIFGGPVGKDELITDTLHLRGYTITRLNKSTHVLYHHEAPWPDCPNCQAEMTTEAQAVDA